MIGSEKPALGLWTLKMACYKGEGSKLTTHSLEEGWSLVYDTFEPEKEGIRETLCTLGNGYFATRGTAPESTADSIHYPGTYLAGGYNKLQTEIEGKTFENEDLVNFPNWLFLTFRVEGDAWFDLRNVEILSYRQELDLKRGILHRRIRFRDSAGRQTSLDSRRLVHMREPHLAAMETSLIPENWSGKVEIYTALDGRVVNSNVKAYSIFNNKHLNSVGSTVVDEETVFLEVQTKQSKLSMAQCARTRLFRNKIPLSIERQNVLEPDYVAQAFVLEVSQGDILTIEKIVSLYTSRDHAISEWGLAAINAVAQAEGFDALLESHQQMWNILWQHFDIDFQLKEGEIPYHELMLLRLQAFHLLQSVSLNTTDLDIGVPARGWHGEAYQGHIFWDDMFIFPFLNLRMPEISRALLMYRYRRLNQARLLARQAGYQGAMYPWQSASSGTEETPKIYPTPIKGQWIYDYSHLQRHVNAAIVYNIWRYYQVTKDVEFLNFFGAEMTLEIARFWASIATYNPTLDRYEIHGVVGPDEYHDAYPDAKEPGLSNNSYTNLMAVWVLRCSLEMLRILPIDRKEELFELLHLQGEEIERWKDISHKMHIVFQENGIVSQFEGYEELEELDWEYYRKKYGDLQRLDTILRKEGDTPNRYKLAKQADLLMLFYLFSFEELQELFEGVGYSFDKDMIPRNIDYYLKRTCNGSTLSRIALSWVLARADRPRSWELFQQALQSDFTDIQGGTTREGIHLGAMSGTMDLIQRCYTGIVTRQDILWLDPCLPEPVETLGLSIRYRGHTLRLTFTQDTVHVCSCPSCADEIQIGYRDRIYTLNAGGTVKCGLVLSS